MIGTPEVICTHSEEYNPSVDLCATNLWSDESATKVDTPYSWFNRGQFPMNRNCVTIGRLVDGTKLKILTLFDTGATKPLLHKFYEQTQFLHSYPKYKIKPRSLKIADSNLMTVDECVKILISFDGHDFEIVVYLVDMLDDFQLVIGSKSMFELEADVKFSNLAFEFAQRPIELLPTKYYCCPPHQNINIKF